jgi:hypothetical protein
VKLIAASATVVGTPSTSAFPCLVADRREAYGLNSHHVDTFGAQSQPLLIKRPFGSLHQNASEAIAATLITAAAIPSLARNSCSRRIAATC